MNVQIIKSHIMNKIPEQPKTAIILGSGLGGFVKRMENSITLPYSEIPNHICSTVSGHSGEWVFGYINKNPIICASGRFHCYEGFKMEEVSLPVSVSHALGCTSLIITNCHFTN